ncbi:MAG: ferrous iron transport protein B, partial [Treponema sp.]|nr:ferrous iron transport protein B [Treponema sp.]
MAKIKIALAGNPNCGKTTMFNSLTGAAQYVGNWPGVTVEKKEGNLKGDKDIAVTDLPGIYSLSPYTNEEVVSRDYLASKEPSSVLNIVDATNIERNLYLTTQILELGKPVVIALNMVDAMRKSGADIDIKKLSERLGCKVVETVALHGDGVKEAAQAAAAEAREAAVRVPAACFAADVEAVISEMQAVLPDSVEEHLKRWTAIKVLERDSVVLQRLSLSADAAAKAEALTKKIESAKDDDIESIITNERYNYITSLLKGILTKPRKKMTVSDKIDSIVTNRVLGIPIFLVVMWFVYWVAVSTVGGMATDWANDSFVGGIQGWVEEALGNAGANEILTDCIVNGIIGGLGAIFGFLPQMAILFLLLSILEDCGYMVRIAFVMDRLFRHFGLSGKSFIPLLISSGCGIPGIMASRTIENENDRRMTIMTTTWIPCGAKLPVIALL